MGSGRSPGLQGNDKQTISHPPSALLRGWAATVLTSYSKCLAAECGCGRGTWPVRHAGPRRSSSNRIRFAPHRGCSRRSSITTPRPPQPPDADTTAAGTNDPPTRARALTQIPAYPGMHRLRRNPDGAATPLTEAPANTARTVSNRCSTTDNATSATPRPPARRHPRNIVELQGRTRNGVSSTYRH